MFKNLKIAKMYQRVEALNPKPETLEIYRKQYEKMDADIEKMTKNKELRDKKYELKNKFHNFLEAVKEGNFEKIQSLYTNEFDLNNNDTNPLDIACYYNHHEIIKFLINNGADVNKTNFRKSTPLEYALKEKSIDYNSENKEISTEIVKTLLENGAKYNDYCVECCLIHPNSELLKLLLDHNLDPNYTYETFQYQASLLEIALTHKNLEATKLLLEYGANPNTLDARGRKPLEALYSAYEASLGTIPLLDADILLKLEAAFINRDYSKINTEFVKHTHLEDYIKWKSETKIAENSESFNPLDNLSTLNEFIKKNKYNIDSSLKNRLENKIKGIPTLQEIATNKLKDIIADVFKRADPEEVEEVSEQFNDLPVTLRDKLYDYLHTELVGSFNEQTE